MEIARGGDMDEADDITVGEELDRTVRIVGRFIPSRHDVPFIVVIFVVVTGYLLLARANGISLNV